MTKRSRVHPEVNNESASTVRSIGVRINAVSSLSRVPSSRTAADIVCG